MREPEFDPRFVDWLHDGPSAPSDWVLASVERHARRHPRRRALYARWSDAMKAVALRHPLAPATRVAAAAVVVIAAAGRPVRPLARPDRRTTATVASVRRPRSQAPILRGGVGPRLDARQVPHCVSR
jgi:hypothetical protein